MSDKNKSQETESSGFGFGTLALFGAAVGAAAYMYGKNSAETPQCNATSSSEARRQAPSQNYVRNSVKCDKCSICLDSMDVLVLPCRHSFHKGCAREWLKTNACCPLCRAPAKY